MTAGVKRAREVLRIEAEAIRRLIPRVGKSFEVAATLLVACKGRVAVTGMGKAGLIGQKLSATDRKSTRLNSSHSRASRMPSSA